jgi:hypothetical protein
MLLGNGNRCGAKCIFGENRRHRGRCTELHHHKIFAARCFYTGAGSAQPKARNWMHLGKFSAACGHIYSFVLSIFSAALFMGPRRS